MRSHRHVAGSYQLAALFLACIPLAVPRVFAEDTCPQIRATLATRFHIDPVPRDLAVAAQRAICNSADLTDENYRINLPESSFAYLGLDARPVPLVQECASNDRRFFQRHALDLALLVAPLELPAIIVKNCDETGLHLLAADNGLQVELWAHYFGGDLQHRPVSAGLEYDHKALDCYDQGVLRSGMTVPPGQSVVYCHRHTRADIPIKLTLQASKESAKILLIGDRTVSYRYSIDSADGAVFCVRDGARVAGPAVPLTGELRRQRDQLQAYCAVVYGSALTVGPGKAGTRSEVTRVKWTAESTGSGQNYRCLRDGIAAEGVMACADGGRDWPQCQAEYFRTGNCALRHLSR